MVKYIFYWKCSGSLCEHPCFVQIIDTYKSSKGPEYCIQGSSGCKGNWSLEKTEEFLEEIEWRPPQLLPEDFLR